MKKIYFGMLCLLMFSCNYDEQFDDLNQEFNLLNERLDNLNDELVAVRTAVAELAAINNELDIITSAIKSLEDSNDLEALTSGLQNLRDGVTILENSIGEDNTVLLNKIKELQNALEVANSNGDDRAALITEEIAALEEQLILERDNFATNTQMQSLLQDIVAVRTSLNALLSQNAFFNGNVTIRSMEDLEYYKGVLNGQALRFINGYLEIEALEGIQGLSIQDPELLNDFLQSIEVVTRSVYITTEGPLNLSSLVNVGGIYRVTGHAVVDTALTVTGGMFLDYDGGYFYPNLRQVNEYTLNIEDGLAEGLLALISQFIPELGFNYGAIQLSNYNREGNNLGTLGIDFSGLQVPTVIFSEVNYVEGGGILPIPLGLATGIIAPVADTIKLGKGITSYVFAPMASYVELNVERNYFTFEESFDYPGDASNANETYPTEVLAFFSGATDSFSGFVVASKDGEGTSSEVVLKGNEAVGRIFVMADRVSAPDLEKIANSSWIESPNVYFPVLNQILNSGNLNLIEESIIGSEIGLININGFESVNAIKDENPLSSGQVIFYIAL